ncbi:MAG: ISL3 family transposase [Clostridia bacterium]
MDNSVSIPTVNRYIAYSIFLNNKKEIHRLPEMIGIDEFKGNAGKYKYQLQIIDLQTKKVVDIVKFRTYDDLEQYFSRISNRKEVVFVTMDLYSPFKLIIQDKFFNATIVADTFHYTRLVLNVLDSARIDFQRNLSKEYRKYFKGIQKILMMRECELTNYLKERLIEAFRICPDLKKIYDIKEKFLFVNDAIGSSEKEILFRNWLYETESSDMYKYFKSTINTFRTWHKYISNSFKYELSNGITEGMNNKIKVLKRISYGFRNFDNFRNRILIACA